MLYISGRICSFVRLNFEEQRSSPFFIYFYHTFEQIAFVAHLQVPSSITMGYHTQVLPIRYSGRRQLETYLREMLGSSDFQIESVCKA